MINHAFLLSFDQHPDKEGLVQVEDEAAVHEADAVLCMERVDFPVSVSNWILEEARYVFERSPFLCVVSWLFHCVNKLAKVAISGLHQSSIEK